MNETYRYKMGTQAPLTYSWIALAASTPVILLLTTWTLAVFHCRRRQWATIDVFLVSILSQSIIQQFLGFIYSVLALLKLNSSSTGDSVCTGMLWFFISIPIFKGASIVSLLIDRWLFAHKFDYRLCVRKNHIRYHIGVLAILSSIVGFTALLTFNDADLVQDNSWETQSYYKENGVSGEKGEVYRNRNLYSFDHCTFLPFKFDMKFVFFYLGAHGIIILIGMIAILRTTCGMLGSMPAGTIDHQYIYGDNRGGGRDQSRKKKRRLCSRNISLDLTPTLSDTSTASSNVSAENPLVLFSTPGLKAKAVLNSSSTAHLAGNSGLGQSSKHYGEPPKSIMMGSITRTSTAIGLVILTVISTHLPLLIGTLVSWLVTNSIIDLKEVFPMSWPLTNVILWCHMMEGLSLLLILLTLDSAIPGWVFQKKNKQKEKDSSKNYLTRLNEERSLYKTNYGPSHGRLNNCSTLRAQTPQNFLKYTNGSTTCENKSANKFPLTNGSLFASLSAAAAAAASASKSSTRDPCRGDTESNIYTSLTNEYDSFGSFEKTLNASHQEIDKKSHHKRCASVTTVADDDFEFHQVHPTRISNNVQNPLSKGKHVTKMSSCQPKPMENSIIMKKSPAFSNEKAIYDHNHSRPQTSSQHYFLPSSTHYFNVDPFRMMESSRTKDLLRNTQRNTSSALPPPCPSSSSHPLTSLSMNDLDLIDDFETHVEPPRHSQAVEYKNHRLYRKRPRHQSQYNDVHPHPPFSSQPFANRQQNFRPVKSNSNSKPYSRRVLSLECLSSMQTEAESNGSFDVSYLDTGDVCLVKQNANNRCVFVTDFI